MFLDEAVSTSVALPTSRWHVGRHSFCGQLINLGLQLVSPVDQLSAQCLHLRELVCCSRFQSRFLVLVGDKHVFNNLAMAVLLTWFRSCCVFNPAPYHVPVAVIAATAPVSTTRRTLAVLGPDIVALMQEVLRNICFE